MKSWLIIHSLEAFRQHPDYVGTEQKKAAKIEKIKKGDRIAYYATGDSVIVGTFDVAKGKEEWTDDESWLGLMTCMKITPRVLAKPPQFVPIQELIKRIDPPLDLFPDRNFAPIRLKGRTSIEITNQEFNRIEKFIRSYQPTLIQFKGSPNDGNLGEPRDLGILNYAPTSEQGVVALFVHFMGKLRDHKFVKIEFIRAGFPDACVIEKEGNLYNRKYIEFEFKASSFREHIKNKGHRNTKCDYVVCWENDYCSCPIEVIELRAETARIMKE